MSSLLYEVIARNRAGEPAAVPSVCSAHPEILTSALHLARDLERPLIIEATSNQVNQFGGYTGMRAADFMAFVNKLISTSGIDPTTVVLGGDHLGPQVWNREPAEQAMDKAKCLVAEYSTAGIQKIHLDCSEGCAGEAAQVSDELAAARAAELAVVCRNASENPQELVFVVGTEVPPPGGVRMDDNGNLVATTPQNATKTINAHRAAFEAQGAADLWGQVAGLVVQPGVEFSFDEVHQLPLGRDPGLRSVMMDHPHLCLEAHSTDYQPPDVYPRLAELGFAFQKVGPALTYAWRRALYALDHLRSILQPGSTSLPQVVESAMRKNPVFWRDHYPASGAEVAWHFGLSDRIRYYWTDSAVAGAVTGLLDELATANLPDHVYLEVFEPAVLAQSARLGESRPLALARAQVQQSLAPYFFGANTWTVHKTLKF